MRIIVSDSSCLIDLRKASLLDLFLRLPYEILIPNTLLEEELVRFTQEQKESLVRDGLQVIDLPGERVLRAQAVSRALPLFETMRAFENSGLLSAAKAFEEQQAALRSALQPLGELQLASRLIADSPLLRDLERSREAIATLQSRFVLPDWGEMTRLVDALRSRPLSAGLVGFAEQRTGLRDRADECTVAR
jgi:hypothetical protein